MIGRRNIRVKVMQTLYTLASDENINPDEQKEKGLLILKEKLNRSLDLFVISALYTLRVAQYAEKDAGQRASKYLPTQEDLNVNTKIAGNEFLWRILENETFQERIKDTSIQENIDPDVVKKVYQRFVKTPVYLEYISTKDRNYKQEVNILRAIWQEQFLMNEDLMDQFSEELPDWDDDIDMTNILMENMFKSSTKINFLKLISAEKNEYAQNLLKTAIDKEDYCSELIQPKLKNWDKERVALIDMLLLKMGVCEFLYFPTIPTKVTINEFIEIAKQYSTPQSGQFVNGVLDNILKDLTKEDKIVKEQRAKK